MPTIADHARVVSRAAVLLDVAATLGLPALATEHYPAGLGRTVDAVAGALPDPAARVEKTRFSGLVPLVDDWLRSQSRDQVLVAGIEAHVCVLQTILDLQDSGRQAFVVTDAIGSSQPDQIGHALIRMDAAGGVRTGVMGAMYELLGDAAHPCARACFGLARRLM